MRAPVCCQVVHARECLAAYLAHKRLVVRVNTHVDGHLMLQLESLAALRTREWFLVVVSNLRVPV